MREVWVEIDCEGMHAEPHDAYFLRGSSCWRMSQLTGRGRPGKLKMPKEPRDPLLLMEQVMAAEGRENSRAWRSPPRVMLLRWQQLLLLLLLLLLRKRRSPGSQLGALHRRQGRYLRSDRRWWRLTGGGSSSTTALSALWTGGPA